MVSSIYRLAGGFVCGVAAVFCLAVLGPAVAWSQSAQDFADWTSASGNVASGTLFGQSISLSGTHVSDAPLGSTVDGSSTRFNEPFFTPPLPMSDAIEFRGQTGGGSYLLQFGAPARDPVLHLDSLGSTLEFQAGTQITKVSGESTFTISGNTVTGVADPDPAQDDASGTVRLSGSFQSISFTATYPPGIDGIVVQVGAVPPTPPPAPPGGDAAPPLPKVESIAPAPAAPIGPGRPVVLTARVSGDYDRLLWNVAGDNRPEIVGSAGQDTVRFRPPPGQVTVSVQPVGPGGAGAVQSRSMVVPAPPGGAVLGRIGAIVKKAPPVYAVGSEQELGRAPGGFKGEFKHACFSLTTVRAGPLEATGCLYPITDVGEIPAAERAILDEIAARFTLPQRGAGFTTFLSRGLELLDGYLSPVGQNLSLNGLTVEPRGAAVTAVYPQAEVIASSNAGVSVGGLRLAHPDRFEIDVTGRTTIPLCTCARAGGLDALAGFGLVGDMKVSLVGPSGGAPAGALIDVTLRLPEFLKLGSLDFEGRVRLRATNDDGLIVDDLRIGPVNANLGALDIEGFQLDYKRGFGGEWRGQGKACVFEGNCLDMIPPNGSVVIARDALKFAGAKLGFDPAVPLFPGISLRHILFSLGLDPTRMLAGAGIKASGIYDIDGQLVVAFPSAQAPFVLNPAEVGPGFPGHFYGRRHSGLTVGGSGNASIELPVLGIVPLANGYFLFEYPPGYFALGGRIDKRFGDIVSFTGGMGGEFNAGNGRFNISGEVDTCILVLEDTPIGRICRGLSGTISSRGLAVCAGLLLTDVGVGVVYRPFTVTPYLAGCEISPYEEKNVRGAQAGTQLVRIERGDPLRSIRLDGATGAPRVRVTGPGGQSLESTPELNVKGGIGILRSDKIKTTIVVFKSTPPGSYRIETLSDSPHVKKVSEAHGLPPAKITAEVRGRGAHRVLAYDVRRRPGQRVTFVEVKADGAGRTIGTVAGGGRGELRFTPGPGRDRRRIEAQIELSSVPTGRRVVARFRPPSPLLARPRGLRVGRSGTRLRVSWSRVAGAARYEVAVTTSQGVQRLVRTRKLNTVLKGIAKSSSGRVGVRALARLRTGRPVSARFRRTARRKTRFRPLPRPSRQVRKAG